MIMIKLACFLQAEKECKWKNLTKQIKLFTIGHKTPYCYQ